MNESLVNDILALQERVKKSFNSQYYDNVLVNQLYEMIGRLKVTQKELEQKYNKAEVGSIEEKQLYNQGLNVVGCYQYFLKAYEHEIKKPAAPVKVNTPSTGAIIGPSYSADTETKSNKGSTGKGIAIGLLIAGAITAAVFGLTRCAEPANTDSDLLTNKTEQKADEDNEVKMPKYTDASNEKQVEARAKWYYETYFNKLFSGLSEVAKETANEDTLADNMPVLSGGQKLYTDFNAETDVIEANNAIVQQFCSYLSLDNKTGKTGFVPSQYLYIDGSYEQKCAAEVDAVLEPLVKAINNKDDEAFKKYATEFGVIMANQYYYPDITDGHYNVRGMADSASRIHLWSISYAEYTNKIMTYGLEHDIDVCVPFCIDYTTGKMVEVPLSKLMAMLEFVPEYEWDAVLARAGISVEALEKMGNKDADNTMPVIFTTDAKNHYKGIVPTLK